MFYTKLKTEFYYLLLMFHEIAIFIYHSFNFLFDIFLTRICLYSESWLRICVYNLHQHIKNDTDSTDVVENDYKYYPFFKLPQCQSVCKLPHCRSETLLLV
jgi:hypothetical protein